MGDEDHRRTGAAATLVDELGDGPLAGQVEGQQRLVAQQDAGVPEQGLGDAQPLLLAAREQADRGVGVGRGADGLHHVVESLPLGPGAQRHAPAMPVEAEADQIPGPDRQILIERPLLGDIAHLVVAAVRCGAVDQDRARRHRDETEQHLQEGGLAHPVRPEHGQELTGAE